MKKLIGATFILLFILILSTLLIQSVGWLEALKAFGFSILLTTLFVVGITMVLK